jgi:probable rRNA maturation factor
MPDPDNSVIFRGVSRRLPRRRLREFASRLQQSVARGREFGCLLTDDRELRRLNRQFLGHDYATDVLSFPAPDADGSLGEMAISVERAAEQAHEFGHSLEQEIGILMLHGLLHLKGMDHEGDCGRMARVERRYRKAVGLPVGLIERARR